MEVQGSSIEYLGCLQCQSGWLARGLSKVTGKTSGLLSARDTVPLATTRAIMVTSLSPPKSHVSVSHSTGQGNVVFQLPGRVQKAAGGVPRYQQMIWPKVETSSKGSAFLLLSTVKLDPSRLGQMAPMWPRIWIFCSNERTRHSRSHQWV